MGVPSVHSSKSYCCVCRQLVEVFRDGDGQNLPRLHKMWLVLPNFNMGVLRSANTITAQEGIHHLLSHLDLGGFHRSDSSDHPDISQPSDSFELEKPEMSIRHRKDIDKWVYHHHYIRQIARAKSNSTIAGLQLGDYPCVHRCHVLPLSFAQGGHKHLRGGQHPLNLGLSG